MSNQSSKAVLGYVFAAPATLFVAFLLAAPLVMMILSSFWTQTYLDIDRTLTLTNYRKAIGDPLYQQLFVRSLWISGLVTLITVLTAYPIAYFIAFRARRKTLWLFLVTIPFWTSYLLRVFSWKLVLGYNGVLNSGLQTLNLIEEPLELLLYNPNAVVLTLTHAWAPFAILPIFVSLQKIDASLLEAASDLGEGAVGRFLRVTLPLSMPGVVAACLIIFIPTIGDYVTPALVGGSDGRMIANQIQVQFGKANNWPLGAALSICAMLSVAVIALTFVAGTRAVVKRIR